MCDQVLNVFADQLPRCKGLYDIGCVLTLAVVVWKFQFDFSFVSPQGAFFPFTGERSEGENAPSGRQREKKQGQAVGKGGRRGE
jgi:hypothetical protein